MKKHLIFLVILGFLAAGINLYSQDTEIIKPPKKGYVTLSKEEYEKILEKLKPKKTEEMKPVQDWTIKSADYELTIGSDLRVSGKAVFSIESFRNDIWIEAPLQNSPRGMGFSIPPDGVVLKYTDEAVTFGTNRKGSFSLSAQLHPEVEKSDLNRYNCSLFVSNAVINRFTIKYRSSAVKMQSFPFITISSGEKEGFFIVKGLAEAGNELTFDFETIEAAAEAGAEKRTEADVRALYTIEPGNIRSSFTYSISAHKKGLEKLELGIPQGMEIMSAGGKEVITWEENRKGDTAVLAISLDAKSETLSDIVITGETPYEGKDSKQKLPMLEPVSIDRVKGMVALAATDETEIQPESNAGLQEIDITELPSTLSPLPGTKMVFAYKYSWNKQDPLPSAVFAIRQYDKAAVLTANIESAEFTTLHTQRGKTLLRARYNIRNNIKQHLKITPPPGYVLWSSFIGGDSVKPIVSEDGSLLVPLKKSLDPSSSVLFSLELILYGQKLKMEESGKVSFDLPECDLQIMKMGWELMLPDNYDYDEWEGNYRQVAVTEFSDSVRRPDEQPKEQIVQGYMTNRNDLVNQFSFNEVQQRQVVEQTDRLIQQFQKKESAAKLREGRFPVKFDLPRIGKQFLFNKLLLIGKAPSLNVEYELDD